MDPLMTPLARPLGNLSETVEAGFQGPAFAWIVVAAVVGVVLLWFAVSPGRRARHESAVASHPVVVDNAVIASSLAERIRREIDLPKGAVVVGIGHRSADITVHVEPGQEVDKQQMQRVAGEELASYELKPAVRANVRIRRDEGKGRQR